MNHRTQKRSKLTNSSDETEITNLLSGDTVFAIPYFQRSYKWNAERLRQLEEDLKNIVDQGDSHFLGAVIIHGRGSNPADPRVYEVIDGQQRITTLFLYIAATVRALASEGECAEAASLFFKYLAIPRHTSLASNMKLHPCKEDRAQFNDVIADILKTKGLKEKIDPFKPKLLPSTGKAKGAVWNNYKSALRFLKSEIEQGGIARLRDVYQSLLDNMSVVQIDVWNPADGPKIFDSLNSRQVPMTIGDLVRNEIFSRVADEDPERIELIDQNHWQPFYKKFQEDGHNLFDSYFFPYGLIQNPNLRKSEVYTALREDWSHLEQPEAIIVQLSRFQEAFIDIVTGKNTQKHPKRVYQLLRNLFLLGFPTATLPFLMQLSRQAQDRVVTEQDTVDSLMVIESFLVRRAVCGHEPTGLHAVFKRLWIDCRSKPTLESVQKEIRKHKTVVWPTAEDFKRSVEKRPLYGSRITNFLLREYNRSLGGDQPEDIPWIEHVLPDNPAKEWWKSFTKEQHEALKDILANLIPLSKQMNLNLGNKFYDSKRDVYKADSMFKSARAFAQEYSNWTPANIEKRARVLSEWAEKRWPH